MNQFNDDQYDRVCDENEAMQKDINRLESIVEQKNVDLGLCRAELAAANAEVDKLRSTLINSYPDLHMELDEAKKERAQWESVARGRPWVIDNKEAAVEIENLRVRLAEAEAQLREAKIVDYSKLAKLVAFHVLMAPMEKILEKDAPDPS